MHVIEPDTDADADGATPEDLVAGGEVWVSLALREGHPLSMAPRRCSDTAPRGVLAHRVDYLMARPAARCHMACSLRPGCPKQDPAMITRSGPAGVTPLLGVGGDSGLV